jgi:predicted RNase H-like HicB family nuclease
MKNHIKLQQNIKSFIRSNLEGGYVAECLEISVVTQQGNTLDEVVENLIEAVGLHLEDENPEDFGLVANPSIFVTLELQPEYIKA